jgi:L-2-hydroxyglutarate oxidase LhgO
LQGDIEASGGVVLCNSAVTEISLRKNGFVLGLASIAKQEFACTTLINSAGHDAQAVAGFAAAEQPPPRYLAKGQYYAYQGPSPFKHLIYPLPTDGGLGIHASNDLGGAVRFGPDISWIDEVDYEFDDSRKRLFLDAIQKYFPSVVEQRLVPAYAGVRAKLSAPGAPPADFAIHGEAEHGIAGLVNLFGIDSPGLTASLAIGAYVKKILD